MLSRVEDRPTPPEVYNLRVYYCAIVAATAAIMIGYDSAFIGTSISLASFKGEFGLSHLTAAQFANVSANIVSTYQGGCFFGALLGYPLGTLLGRKIGLLITALVFCLGAGVMLAANGARGLGPIYAGRIIAGLGIGAASNLTPLYISEIAPPAIRGQLVGMYEIGWQIGGIVGSGSTTVSRSTLAPRASSGSSPSPSSSSPVDCSPSESPSESRNLLAGSSPAAAATRPSATCATSASSTPLTPTLLKKST